MADQSTSKSTANAVPAPQVDLRALAEKLVELMKHEIKLERERQGWR